MDSRKRSLSKTHTPRTHPDLACIYRRVSTGRQDVSLESQEQKCLDYAKLKNLQVFPELIFEDEAVSGSKPLAERPGGEQMLKVLERGTHLHTGDPHSTPVTLGNLITLKIDRLGRNAQDVLRLWHWAREHRLTIHIVDMGGESFSSQGYIGNLLVTMLAAFAEFELEMIRSRTREGVNRRFEQRRVIGHCPYGFDLIDGTLFDNRTEQGAIRRMIGWRNQGWSYHRIAHQLNREGVPAKRGGQWQSGNVAKVIHSKHTASIVQSGELRP